MIRPVPYGDLPHQGYSIWSSVPQSTQALRGPLVAHRRCGGDQWSEDGRCDGRAGGYRKPKVWKDHYIEAGYAQTVGGHP